MPDLNVCWRRGCSLVHTSHIHWSWVSIWLGSWPLSYWVSFCKLPEPHFFHWLREVVHGWLLHTGPQPGQWFLHNSGGTLILCLHVSLNYPCSFLAQTSPSLEGSGWFVLSTDHLVVWHSSSLSRFFSAGAFFKVRAKNVLTRQGKSFSSSTSETYISGTKRFQTTGKLVTANRFRFRFYLSP